MPTQLIVPIIDQSQWHGGQFGVPGSGPVMNVAANLLPGSGNVFYVWGRNGGIGSDSHDGLTPQYPLLTLTYALSLCTNDAQDTIVIMSYSAPTGETWPISVAKESTHIIGASGGGNPVPYITPPGDTAAFSIAQDKIQIQGLSINGGATHGCVETSAAAARWGLRVDSCFFGVVGAGQDGIRNVAAGDAPYLEVTRCTFGAGLTRDGIRIDHNATRSRIGTPWGLGNVFDRVGGVGVNVVGNAVQVGIHNNVFVPVSDGAGLAISLPAGATNCVISGNVANFGKTAMAANPFVDAAGANANHWMGNMHNITLTDPA